MILFHLENFKYLIPPFLKYKNIELGKFSVNDFENGETHIEIDNDVKDKKCIVIGETAPSKDSLFTLLLLSHTLKKEGATEVIAIIPYLGYERQDKDEPKKSWTGKWLGEVLRASGISKIITLDIHSHADTELFLPIVSIPISEIFKDVITKFRPSGKISVVSPDDGAIERCSSIAKELGQNEVSYFKKERNAKGVIHSKLYGDIYQKIIIVDDILDTGKTLINCCEQLNRDAMKDISIIVTHGIFTGDKWKKLFDLGVKKIYCTNSIPKTARIKHSKIEITPISEVIAKYLMKYEGS